MSDPVLELKGIEKVYNPGQPGEIRVLRGLDLCLFAGEAVALVAPSGAGKSTLLHIAGLLDTPDAGEVRIGGEAMQDLPDRRRTAVRRADVGFVYQFHHLLPEFTAAENIVLPQLADGVAPGAARARAAELLASVGGAERAGHRPAALSDEPTGNLDPATSDRVFGALMDLVRQTGLAALVATHNMALAERMDRVVRLDGGVLVAG